MRGSRRPQVGRRPRDLGPAGVAQPVARGGQPHAARRRREGHRIDRRAAGDAGRRAARGEGPRVPRAAMSHPILARVGTGYTVSALEPVKGPDGRPTPWYSRSSSMTTTWRRGRGLRRRSCALRFIRAARRGAVPSTLSDALALVIGARSPAVEAAVADAKAGKPEPHPLEAAARSTGRSRVR